jgi:tRNA threonylcarbamoyladenosine biosynthesis protein TsaB
MSNAAGSMKTVAIDTSLPEGSVAASDGSGTIEIRFAPAQAHARRVAAALADATAQLGWHVADTDLVAVIRGPGSFTGLRVGIATAKGIAWASGAPVVALSGFEVIAAGGGFLPPAPAAPLHVAFDAGRGELFASRVAPDPASPIGWSAAAGTLVGIADWVAALPHGASISGPALDLAEVTAALAPRSDLHVAPPENRRATAAAAARLGGMLAAAGVSSDVASLSPEYARPSYAQENDPGPSR